MNLNFFGCLPLLFLPLACAQLDTNVESGDSFTFKETPGPAEPGKPVRQVDAMISPADLDEEARAEFMDALGQLEGTWVDAEAGETHFALSSMGSVVRETMFPGQPHEMTNMYTLDGNDLCMTHYCGMGNQPHMRATSMGDGEIVFASDGVSDLKGPDQKYMGAMTIKFVDDNTIEQHWLSFNGAEGEEDTMVFAFKRKE